MPTITHEKFGTCPAGQVDLYTLTNDAGNTVKISTFGAVVQSIQVPDRNGELGEVVIGYDSFEPYLDNPVHFGAIVGRYANRIAGAKFSIKDRSYELTANEGENTLHGGPKAFGHQLWEVLHAEAEEEDAILQLHHVSPAGTNGFPGRLSVSCQYTWSNENCLIIEYNAITERPTVINLTNHSYFNLAGAGTILDHELEVNADRITDRNEQELPTGELRGILNSDLDFTTLRPIKEAVKPGSELEKGIDHNYCINDADGNMTEAAYVRDPKSGRSITCYTTQPGVQVFTTNFEEGEFTHGKGEPLLRHGAICLETQNYPDAPNQPNFPSPILWPEEEYSETTEYWFGISE